MSKAVPTNHTTQSTDTRTFADTTPGAFGDALRAGQQPGGGDPRDAFWRTLGKRIRHGSAVRIK